MPSPDLYDFVFRSKDYAGEAERIHRIVQERAPGSRALLDVACGTGRHLEHLARWYDVEGLDLDQSMLTLARERLANIPLHVGDMRDFDLGREFDAVTCLFSAIASMTTIEDLGRAIGAMARHLQSGGVLVVEPWVSPADQAANGEPWIEVMEEPGRKVVIMETSTLAGPVWIEDEHTLVWTPAGIEHLNWRTEQGAFTAEDHFAAFRAAGVDVEHDPVGLIGRGLFIGVRRPGEVR